MLRNINELKSRITKEQRQILSKINSSIDSKQEKPLLDDEFRRLLTLSKTIENQIKQDQPKKDKLELEVYKHHFSKETGVKSPISAEQYKKLQKKIADEIKEKNTFCRKFSAQHDVLRQNKKKAELNKQYLVELQTLYSDRAILHLRKKLGQYGSNDFQDTYQRVLHLTDPAKAIFNKNGIPGKDYIRFTQLDRSQAGTNIPDIGIFDCGNGFYMKKLDVSKQDEGALAACLGEVSDCCQSLSGEVGEMATIHGLTNPNSGFYVLFKGDPKKPKITDTVFGQTWVCRTSSFKGDPKKQKITDTVLGQTWVCRTSPSGLLFDSIESAQGKEDEKDCNIVKTAFRNLASALIKRRDVLQVYCGGPTHGISKHVGLPMCYRMEPPKEYAGGFRDSYTQLFLADQRILGTFTDDNKFVIDEKAVKSALHENKSELSEKIRFTIFNIRYVLKNDPLLKSFLDLIPKEELARVNQYIAKQDAFINQCEKYVKDPKKEEKNFLQAIQDKSSLLIDWGYLFKTSARDKTTVLMTVVGQTICGVSLTELLKITKAGIHAQDETGSTALAIAAKKGLYDRVRTLLEAKAMVTNVDRYGNTPLMDAVVGAQRPAAAQHEEQLVKMLLEAKATININTPNAYGDTALIKAGKGDRSDIVRVLLEAKAMINAVNDKSGDTALMNAVTQNQSNNIRVLLEERADTNIKNIKGDTALILAADIPNVNGVKGLLEANANPDIQNKNGMTALISAACKMYNYDAGFLNWPCVVSQKTDLVKALLKAKANPNLHEKENGDTALMCALECGNKDTVRDLLEAKANPNIQNKFGTTALMSVIRNNYVPASDRFEIEEVQCESAIQYKIEMVKTLLAAKANVDIVNKKGESALTLTKDANIIQLLQTAAKQTNPILTIGMFATPNQQPQLNLECPVSQIKEIKKI